jgi:hypothetical protein
MHFGRFFSKNHLVTLSARLSCGQKVLKSREKKSFVFSPNILLACNAIEMQNCVVFMILFHIFKSLFLSFLQNTFFEQGNIQNCSFVTRVTG